MVPEVLQTNKLLQFFYSCNEARLNEQGEALLSLVIFDQEKSTPEDLIYWVDNCIKPESEPFRAIQDILATLLGEVLSEISEGAFVTVKGQAIHFHPVLQIINLEELIREIKKSKPFGNFSLN